MKTSAILVIFILFGCSKVEPNKESLKEIPKKTFFFVKDDNLSLNNWVNYYKNLDSTFSLEKFKFTSKGNLNLKKGSIYGTFDKKFDKIYSNFLVYNNNKNKYLDFDSSQWNIENNNLNFEIDQEVNLVNIREEKVERIEFFGSSSWVENAYWKNDYIVVLLKNSQNRKPLISEINLKTEEITNFTYQDILKFDSNYSEERIQIILKKRNFQ